MPEAFARLTEEEADKRLDPDDINRAALADAEANGIVFLDEIDKIAVSDVRGGSISREGVQRDLLPLIEGTTVATKYGPLKTDHILFIASGAFHLAKPADLLPELQGRLPIRVELKALTQEDFVRILSATRASLTEQYQALLGTEGVTINFADDGIEALARIAAEVNEAVENIGARRLQTVMEKLLEDVSFEAEDRRGETLVVDAAFVERPARRASPATPTSAATCFREVAASFGCGIATPVPAANGGQRLVLTPASRSRPATQLLQVWRRFAFPSRDRRHPPVRSRDVRSASAGRGHRARNRRGPPPTAGDIHRAAAGSPAPRNSGLGTYWTCITRLPPVSADQMRARRHVPPGRGVEIDSLVARAKGDPARIWIGRAKSPVG